MINVLLTLMLSTERTGTATTFTDITHMIEIYGAFELRD